MKYHKITNVPPEICTAEQKIAYNLAFCYRDIVRNDVCYNDTIDKIICLYQSSYTYTPGKYNDAAIKDALHNGLAKYLSAPFVACSYKQIGETFRKEQNNDR